MSEIDVNKMENEIIIDGVDVRECIFLDNSAELNICCCKDVRNVENRFVTYCMHSNCYFKQRQRAKYYLNKIRDYELNSLDIDYDEYEQHACATEYSPIIDFVELALGEKNE